jgi:UTP--glucose-1-phosphate uridylyltransferase
MLPIGNRPIMDYIIEDCVRAGITDIYLVVSNNSTQVETYYSKNIELEEYLVKNGKEDKLPLINQYDGVNFHYVRQASSGKYGTAIPVALALEDIGVNEPVVVVMGDDFVYRTDGGSAVADLIAQYQPDEAIMLGYQILDGDKRKYGFLELDGDKLVKMTEAITISEAPSNLVNISRYIMPPKLLQNVIDYAKSETTEPEYYITTVPFDNFIQQGGVVRVKPATGEYLDGGSLEGWLHANEVVAKSASI